MLILQRSSWMFCVIYHCANLWLESEVEYWNSKEVIIPELISRLINTGLGTKSKSGNSQTEQWKRRNEKCCAPEMPWVENIILTAFGLWIKKNKLWDNIQLNLPFVMFSYLHHIHYLMILTKAWVRLRIITWRYSFSHSLSTLTFSTPTFVTFFHFYLSLMASFFKFLNMLKALGSFTQILGGIIFLIFLGAKLYR